MGRCAYPRLVLVIKWVDMLISYPSVLLALDGQSSGEELLCILVLIRLPCRELSLSYHDTRVVARKGTTGVTHFTLLLSSTFMYRTKTRCKDYCFVFIFGPLRFFFAVTLSG